MVEHISWWLVLFLQGMAFTWVSRARASGSIPYAALVGLASHGLWFATQVFLVVAIFAQAQESDLVGMLGLGALYVSAMVAGQALMMATSMRWFEHGARVIGQPIKHPADNMAEAVSRPHAEQVNFCAPSPSPREEHREEHRTRRALVEGQILALVEVKHAMARAKASQATLRAIDAELTKAFDHHRNML